jgi:hypothetical protein
LTILWNEQLPGTDGPVIFRRNAAPFSQAVREVYSMLGQGDNPLKIINEKDYQITSVLAQKPNIQAVLRIRDVHPGIRIRIFPFRIRMQKFKF